MSNFIDTVDKFKARAKGLIKECKFKQAIEFAKIHYESTCFSELQLQEEVKLLHWWTKIFYRAGDLRTVTAQCLTKVNTLMNTITTSSSTSFKRSDGVTPLTQVEVDQCLAELLYLKRAIDTLI